MSILVTGCAGFIGWKVSELLLTEGQAVVGVDDMNDAYDVRLKEWCLAQICDDSHFTFHRLDIADRNGLREIFDGGNIDAVINLAQPEAVSWDLRQWQKHQGMLQLT